MRRRHVDVRRVFKTHRIQGLPSLASDLWWRISFLDPRLWKARSRLTLEESDTRLAELWESFSKRQDVSADEVRRVRQAYCFLHKWQDSVDGDRLEDAALKQFLDIESTMMASLTAEARTLCEDLNQIMRGWLSKLNLERLPFQHGPGQVAEASIGRNPEKKFSALGSDDLIRYTYRGETFDGAFERVSRLVFVPKTFRAYRTICAEPATLQFYQQGVMRRLYGYIENHKFLRRHLPLTDQSVNGEKALRGSASLPNLPWDRDSLCTIDLSAASDRLPWAVVKAVFKDTPLLRHLWATRSRSVELPGGERLPLKKFAPMGSALCFPIQSLVYAAVLEHSTRSDRTPGSQSWSVFGDDLITHETAYERVCDNLALLGLRVNLNKSFRTDVPFKESCGVDAWGGDDITPIYLRSLKKTPGNLVGLLDLAPRLALVDLAAGQALLNFVLNNLPRYVAASLEIGPDSFTPFPVPVQQGEQKWSMAYQRRLRPAAALAMKADKRMSDDWAYQDWLLRARPDGRRSSPFAQRELDSRVRSVRVVWR